MSHDDLPLFIPAADLLGHFECSICLQQIEQSGTLGSCSHRFCLACAREAVDRNHRCPLCQADVSQQDVHRDTQFDSLAAAFATSHDKAERAYFDKLTGSSSCCKEFVPSSSSNPFTLAHLAIDDPRRALEAVLRRRLRKVISQFMNVGNEVVAGAGDNHLLAAQRLSDVVVDFDKQLDAALPSSHRAMPVRVRLVWPDRNVNTEITLKPSHTLADFETILRTHMAETGRTLIPSSTTVAAVAAATQLVGDRSLPNETSDWLKIRVLAPDGYDKMNVLGHLDGSCDADTVLQLAFENAIPPGSEILVCSGAPIVAPQSCFANTFDASAAISGACDYFKCADCNVSWICQGCAVSCHAGHTLTPFVHQHVPTWGLCYCQRKCKDLCVHRENTVVPATKSTVAAPIASDNTQREMPHCVA